MDEVRILPMAMSAEQVSTLQAGYLPGAGTPDPTHVSRTCFGGLGQADRGVTIDLNGHGLTTTKTNGWNGQPALSYATTGQPTTYAYDAEGVATSVLGPAVAGVSSTTLSTVYPSWLQVQTLDSDGRLSFSQADLLGRTTYRGIRNPAVASGFPTGFNCTSTACDGLGLVTSQSVYAGTSLLQTTTYYYNGAGFLVDEVYPDGTSQIRTYDHDLRLASVAAGMGHMATYAYVGSGQGRGWLRGVGLRGRPRPQRSIPTTTRTMPSVTSWRS